MDEDNTFTTDELLCLEDKLLRWLLHQLYKLLLQEDSELSVQYQSACTVLTLFPKSSEHNFFEMGKTLVSHFFLKRLHQALVYPSKALLARLCPLVQDKLAWLEQDIMSANEPKRLAYTKTLLDPAWFEYNVLCLLQREQENVVMRFLYEIKAHTMAKLTQQRKSETASGPPSLLRLCSREQLCKIWEENERLKLHFYWNNRQPQIYSQAMDLRNRLQLNSFGDYVLTLHALLCRRLDDNTTCFLDAVQECITKELQLRGHILKTVHTLSIQWDLPWQF